MRLKSSKVNEFRLWGLVLMLAGMGFMIAGTAAIVFKFPGSAIITGIGLVLGLITMLGSMGIYFWAGMLSTSAVQLQCPECGETTKILGKTDRCMYCKTILTLDPAQARNP
jgi:membrane-bound ClpP family serine protease